MIRYTSVVLVFVFTWLCIFTASWKTPLICDDNTYVLEYNHGPGITEKSRGENCDFATLREKSVNLISILDYHYKHENGRFTPAVPMRLFAGIPRCYYAMVNALMFLALSLLLCIMSGIHRRWYIPAVFLAVFMLLKADAVFWTAATINYLWPMVLIMICALLFEKARFWKLIHAVWCIPIAFVAAGGHEIMSVPICFALAFFWVIEWIRARRIYIDVRFMMTMAFGLGTLVIFLSPVSPLFRAGYESSSSWSYLLLCKVMTLAFVFVGSPALVVDIALLFVALMNRRYRYVLLGTNLYLLLLLGVGMTFTIMFGNLGARASWPLNVLSYFVLLRLLPAYIRDIAYRRFSMICAACVLLGMTTLLNTVVASIINDRSYELAFKQFAVNSDNVFVIPQRADWLLGFLFDRTHDPRSVVQVAHGETCTNGNLARRLDRPCLIGLFEDDYQWIKNGKLTTKISDEFNTGRYWLGDDSHDLLLQEVCPDSAVDVSVQWGGFVRFAQTPNITTELFMRILRENANRNFVGGGIFRTQVFFERFVRDLIYTTIYKTRVLKGFYIRRGEQIFKVLVHNHYAYRDLLTGVECSY